MNIYLDYNGTTPVDPAVRDEMLPFLGDLYGNPSSTHWAGQAAREAIDSGREQLASLIGGDSEEIVFTGGGSESDNLAIKGTLWSCCQQDLTKAHVITSAVEHPAIINCCSFLERLGVDFTYLDVDRDGMISADQVEAAINDRTVLVSLMLANNETGVIFPIEEISRVTRSRGIRLHTDAVQAVGKIPVEVNKLGVDLLSLSGHKFYAPKGVGALWVRSGVNLEPLIHGGGQEQGRRSGTEAVSNIAAVGKAASLFGAGILSEEIKRLAKLRHDLEAELTEKLQRVIFHGSRVERLPNTTNFSLPGIDGESLRMHLDLQGIAVSTSSACASRGGKGSRVLRAMGVSEAEVQSAIRVSLGRWTTAAEIRQFIDILVEAAEVLWRIS
ncbi:MAG: cysteine desulfurase, partial [Deltaproteobacteria bacterium]|nr:cysteine desulfurase [Deltaproteobacteria bacterium]